MIHITNLYKTFDGFTALNGLSLHAKKGCVYGLVGVNGSGKSTTIRHLAGLYIPDSGEVKIADAAVYDNDEIKAKVGYIPDELYFFPHYNMKNLHDFYTYMYPKFNKGRYKYLKDMFGLDEKRKIRKFSKGMQKQVAFTVAMSTMPDVLLLDEPIDGLDPIVRKDLLAVMLRDVTERQMTVLVSSHNLKEMDGICDSIGIIKHGRMVVERSLNDLKSDIHKIQLLMDKQANDVSALGVTILHQEKRGSIWQLVVRATEDELADKIGSRAPIVFDRLPLTLEEVFIYESGGESSAL